MNAHGLSRRLLTVLLSVLILPLSACVTQLKSVVRPDATAAQGYATVPAAEIDSAVQIYRANVRQSNPLSLRLQKGDEIQTGADSSALLEFADGNEIIIAPNTRVRIGSLEVLFGRVFARVRGLFSTSSDTVGAEVEGTEYLFERGPAGAVQVLVFDGTVRCRSLQTRWAPQRVGAGQRFRIGYDGATVPHVDAMPEALRRETLRWVDSVRSVATPRFSLGKLPFQINIGIGVGGGGGSDRRDATPPPKASE